MGYWNHERKVNPEAFAEVAAIEAELGRGAFMFRDRKTGERFGLLQLDPKAGRRDKSAPDCSLFCDSVAQELDGVQHREFPEVRPT